LSTIVWQRNCSAECLKEEEIGGKMYIFFQTWMATPFLDKTGDPFLEPIFKKLGQREEEQQNGFFHCCCSTHYSSAKEEE
jgi:hypothetical protein